MRRATTFSTVLAMCLALSVAGQSEASESWSGPVDGDSTRGVGEIRDVGCGSCHRIPGIAGADGLVGPPLDFISRRIYLAGVLRNTPQNMMALQDPQKFVPGRHAQYESKRGAKPEYHGISLHAEPVSREPRREGTSPRHSRTRGEPGTKP